MGNPEQNDCETHAELRTLCAETELRMAVGDSIDAVTAALMVLRQDLGSMPVDQVVFLSNGVLTIMPIIKALTVLRA